MLGIGENETIIILVVIFLLFGPDKLPQAGRTVGRAIRQFRETQAKMTSMVQSEIVDPLTSVVQDPSKLTGSAPAKSDTSTDELDSDVDDVATAKAAEARRETFAERRARLAAEQGAASEPEAAAEAVTETITEVTTDTVTVTETITEHPSEPPRSTEPERDEGETAEILATERLYERRPRRHRTVRPAEGDAAGGAEAESEPIPDRHTDGQMASGPTSGSDPIPEPDSESSTESNPTSEVASDAAPVSEETQVPVRQQAPSEGGDL